MISITALDNYLAHLQATNTLSDTYEFGYSEGDRYYRVYRSFHGQKSVVSFVDKETGTIYKSKGWKAASKTVLGNVSDYQVDAVHTEPEMQIHPEIESQEQPEEESLNPEQVMALEAKLEIAYSDETPAEASQDNEQADEVMSPQELLVESEEWFVMIPGQDPVGGFTSSTQAREFAEKQGMEQGTYSIRDKQYVGSRLSEDKLGRMLAEGLKTLQPDSINTHPIIQYLTRLADAGDAEARQFLQTQSIWFKGVKGSSSNRRISPTALEFLQKLVK